MTGLNVNPDYGHLPVLREPLRAEMVVNFDAGDVRTIKTTAEEVDRMSLPELAKLAGQVDRILNQDHSIARALGRLNNERGSEYAINNVEDTFTAWEMKFYSLYQKNNKLPWQALTDAQKEPLGKSKKKANRMKIFAEALNMIDPGNDYTAEHAKYICMHMDGVVPLLSAFRKIIIARNKVGALSTDEFVELQSCKYLRSCLASRLQTIRTEAARKETTIADCQAALASRITDMEVKRAS